MFHGAPIETTGRKEGAPLSLVSTPPNGTAPTMPPPQRYATYHVLDVYLNSGPHGSVAGSAQARAFCDLLGGNFCLNPAAVLLLFSSVSAASIWTIELRISFPNGSCLFFDFHVLQADIPVLLGLDVMRGCEPVMHFKIGELR